MPTPAKTPTPAAVPVTTDTLATENTVLGGGLTTREQIDASRARMAAKHGLSPADMQAALDVKRSLHLVAAKMSEMNWGKGLDEMTRRAVAAYLERNRLDLTEVDVLGGNLYRNARYYKRRLAEMVEDGKIEYVKSDWVQNDARLDLHNDEWSTSEKTRRDRVRIEYGIPDAATGACVFRIKVRGVDVEFTAAKWAGGGTRKADPIGEQFPIESSETRACRRAMTLCASSIPALRWREEDLTEQGVDLSAVIREGRARSDREVLPSTPRQLVAHPDGDAYGAVGREGQMVKELSADEELAFDAAIAERDDV